MSSTEATGPPTPPTDDQKRYGRRWNARTGRSSRSLAESRSSSFLVGIVVRSIFGEELSTVLPFLAVMAFCTRGGLSRKRSLLVALLVTAVWFGAAHLPTYQWNFAQAFLIIGVARSHLHGARGAAPLYVGTGGVVLGAPVANGGGP